MKGKTRNEATRALNNRSVIFSEEPLVASQKNNKRTKKSHAIHKQKFADDWESGKHMKQLLKAGDAS